MNSFTVLDFGLLDFGLLDFGLLGFGLLDGASSCPGATMRVQHERWINSCAHRINE
ncbi:hypothetical protein [Nonomuraea gerenzanensis]|uniref:Uncharacterized protein n=1 Tax=Nonomuraea gerenzanensis TaxID=93944 RepID=A0A1M4E5K5_9ACTN|nr:hypothetical protein [Nonomuraea gerenzanensis]UBU16317.1 hypothetical protein LCN96_15265 [Nonomuraea gerenzanensis]SBO94135.1 hypothetical protein BN4615_P3651 [Nonomuraea gerenzanensis]